MIGDIVFVLIEQADGDASVRVFDTGGEAAETLREQAREVMEQFELESFDDFDYYDEGSGFAFSDYTADIRPVEVE